MRRRVLAAKTSSGGTAPSCFATGYDLRAYALGSAKRGVRKIRGGGQAQFLDSAMSCVGYLAQGCGVGSRKCGSCGSAAAGKPSRRTIEDYVDMPSMASYTEAGWSWAWFAWCPIKQTAVISAHDTIPCVVRHLL